MRSKLTDKSFENLMKSSEEKSDDLQKARIYAVFIV